MDKIHLKRLKRKKILEGRIECHGSKYSCLKLKSHFKTNKVPKLTPEKKKAFNSVEPFFKNKDKKPGFFTRLFNRKVA